MSKTFSREYLAYINGPGWVERKLAYYRRHPKRCRACGTRFGIQLHHLTYVQLGHEHDRDLMPLCLRHHQLVDVVRRFGFGRRTATWLVVLFARRSHHS